MSNSRRRRHDEASRLGTALRRPPRSAILNKPGAAGYQGASWGAKAVADCRVGTAVANGGLVGVGLGGAGLGVAIASGQSE